MDESGLGARHWGVIVCLLGGMLAPFTSILESPHPDERFAFAPMMDYTDRHFRFLTRLLTKRGVLYTEMVPANTIIHQSDNVERWLRWCSPFVLFVCVRVFSTLCVHLSPYLSLLAWCYLPIPQKRKSWSS